MVENDININVLSQLLCKINLIKHKPPSQNVINMYIIISTSKNLNNKGKLRIIVLFINILQYIAIKININWITKLAKYHQQMGYNHQQMDLNQHHLQTDYY